MKRAVTFLVIIFMVLLCFGACAEQEGLYTYEINDDNTVTITGFDWDNNHGDIYIPEMLGNRIISSIGEKAFAITGNTAIKITLPDNIRSIGAEAFHGVAITYINIPLKTVEIGGGAFAQCNVMRFNVADGHSVFATIDNSLYNKQTKTLIAWPENKELSEIPKGIKSIGDYAFYGRDFSGFSAGYALPESIETIGEYAFAKTSGLELIAKNTHTIGNHCFEEAKLVLKTNKLSIIGDYAFYKAGVEILNDTDTPLSISKIGKHAFQESWFTIHNSTNEEYYNTFSNIPYEVEEYAFAHAKGYYKEDQTIISLKNIKSIGAHAFERMVSNMTDLTDTYNTRRAKMGIMFKEEDDLENLVYIGEYAFYDTPVARWGNKANGYFAYAYFSNKNLEIIPKGAFESTGVTDVKVGSSAKSIDEGAFRDCDYLERVKLEDGVLSIGDEAFSNCDTLDNVKLNEGLLTIGNKVFSGCKKLNEIYIPASVNMIGNEVFNGCAETFVVTVEAGSYGEVWARTCGYAYVVNGVTEDTSWLD